ncbi:MAG: hypothetical protein HYX24_07590 [Candidatus Aenigmarchaeota archaeon]|nr:hypothetical protein [Candidatus Aenigmarchaeota archaeon]
MHIDEPFETIVTVSKIRRHARTIGGVPPNYCLTADGEKYYVFKKPLWAEIDGEEDRIVGRNVRITYKIFWGKRQAEKIEPYDHALL